MKNWKKWLSAGLLAAVLGAAGISAPATVSANAGYLPYDRIDNLAPEETMARVRVFSGSTEGEAARAWKKIDGVCYNGSGKKIDGAITRGIDVSQWQETIDWKLVKKGMEEAVKAINEAYGFKKDEQITMTFEGPDDEQDVESQINIIDAVIAENPDVLCISASDVDSCQAQLEAAKENGIPVISFDSNVSENKLVRAYRGTDNVQVGKMAAYRLGTTIGKMGRVAVFSAQEKTQSVQDRVEGFVTNIEKYGDIEVVEIVYSDQVDDMEAAMKEVLDKYPGLDGVFCTNADITEMYLDMDKSEESDLPALVGVDATSKQQEAIRNGDEIGCVSQQPYAMGYQTIWAAIQTTAPKKSVTIEKEVLISPAWIGPKALDDPEYSAYLYTE